MSKFAEFGLSKPIQTALADAGITDPTEIQIATIEPIIAGRDLIASAQTGSGKTASFALPIIECLDEPEKKPRALVLAPTRELALQVEEEFKRFAKHSQLRTVTLYGGTGYDKQLNALRRNVDIVVATPGRLLDCVERKYVDLSAVEILVLDEADRLLDLGFMPQIRKIISKIPKERQTLMFSATIDARIQKISREYMIDPMIVKANVDRIDVAAIEQRFLHVTEFSKDALLLKLIQEYNMTSILVFTRTKRKAGWVKDRLQDAGVEAEEIHSDISQNQRERTLLRYRKGAFPVLVATDVAARGLDIPTISHVINYDLPEVPEDYVHRIGRTGRAGRAGMAFSFVSEEQRFLVRDIQKLLGQQPEPDPNAAKKALAARRLKARGRRRMI